MDHENLYSPNKHDSEGIFHILFAWINTAVSGCSLLRKRDRFVSQDGWDYLQGYVVQPRVNTSSVVFTHGQGL